MPTPKQVILNRYRAILQATLDYLLELNGGMIVYDQMDPMTEYYQELKVKTEQYYHQGRLDRLKYRLDKLTSSLQNMTDLNFSTYIKGKTGYDIDIFEDLSNRVDVLIAKGTIKSQKEHSAVRQLLRYYEKTTAPKEVKAALNILLTTFSPKESKNLHNHIISEIEKDGVAEMRGMAYTGPKLKHYEQEEIISPDGKRMLTVTQQSAGSHNSTSVSITFPKAHGEIYTVNEICSDIKANWKDNSTIMVTTKKEYLANTKHLKMRSFDDVIAIEYLEN